MKRIFSVAILITALAATACDYDSDMSTAKDGTGNDLPNPILRCVETMDGAVVADGRVEATLGRDQLSQHSAQVVQKDQFSGNTVLAAFPYVEEIDARSVFGGLIDNPPTVVYVGESEGKHLTLSLWDDAADVNRSTGSLVLRVDVPASVLSVQVECRKG